MIVDDTGDDVTENANEGIDTVMSSVGYDLGDNVENLDPDGYRRTTTATATLSPTS